MIVALTLLLETLACLGFGALLLRAAGVSKDLPGAERAFWAFALGFGVVGWAVFFLGLGGRIQPMWLGGLLAVGTCGVPLLGPFSPPREVRFSWPGLLIGGAIGSALIFDLFEGFSPPADADTLAYHFAVPRDWIAAGHLLFVPRAVDGAVPYLVNATYAPALALGGERALTLWAMLTGWAGAALAYVVARRWLEREWAGAAALILLTLPTMVFAGGSGQVEPRIVLFATVALLALAEARRTGRPGFALVAGLAAGFYIGSKYMGLLFALPIGLVILMQRRWLVHGLVFGLAALVGGFQWYFWNWGHTGDPVFPMLYHWLGSPFWSTEVDALFRGIFFRVESPLPRTVGQFLAYPIYATIGSAEQLEATRTGAGPYLLLILPLVGAGLWRFRARLAHHPLASVALAIFLYYGLWFFFGPSQRVRHLLPLMPLAIVAATLVARRWAETTGTLAPLAAAVAATVLVQLGGQALFSMSYVRHVTSNESRDDFLVRTVTHSAPVPWINAHLGPADKVIIATRQLAYILTVPSYCANPTLQSLIETGEENRDAGAFLAQLRRQGATHVLTELSLPQGLSYLTATLVAAGCAERVQDFEAQAIGSRTLPGMNTGKALMTLVKLKPEACEVSR